MGSFVAYFFVVILFFAVSQIRGIIVENTFTSMQDLVKHLSPAFSKYMVRAMTNKWDTLSIIGNISKPMLLLSGRADEIVPPRMMTALYKAAILSQGRELAAFPKVCEHACDERSQVGRS